MLEGKANHFPFSFFISKDSLPDEGFSYILANLNLLVGVFHFFSMTGKKAYYGGG
jgi:hypothetical protein